ncbi:Thioesterase/thiol ester dehydrase-isomerase [Microthyrium microscopicum]|uniref:Thioesterase/thiol ester dehydrase-isomerase n=1 Tax=Microthyrium microscopicum TaxID=703497 RepID=A0A6A6TX56_9PEZI|nr:Thioesterase/thiol ester dehydrase-isomerase [Microthyrium microscopicum]
MSFHHSTLVKPPPSDPNKAEIESILELTQLSPIDPDLFTNTRPLWQPPGARGLFGGCIIAQCLAAAYKTIPDTFSIHSMHCYFVLAGSGEIPVLYHVERIRSGRSFATRTVQARQGGNVIFTTTMSFVRENSGGKKLIEHAVDMPYVPGPDHEKVRDVIMKDEGNPIMSRSIDILNSHSPLPHVKKTRQWVKARGRISEEGGHQAHVAAVAYFSDHFFIGTISRVHNIWRIPVARLNHKAVKVDEDVRKDLRKDEDDATEAPKAPPRPRTPTSKKPKPVVSMMVSLDHTIYFHEPRRFRADEWLFTEMESPWAGDGRGLVIQKIFTQKGVLVATCVQEGVVRLKQDEPAPKL